MNHDRTISLLNPFDQQGNWYKANLHSHTVLSDGDSSLEERVRQYRERDYSVLAVTDHEKMNDVTGLSTDDFLVLSGIETHPKCEGSNAYHLVCLNVPLGAEFPPESDANTRIRIVKDAGGEVIFGHPYWCGHNINHILAIEGYIAVEVYNATCTKIGKGISSVQWDDVLDAGRTLPAVAVDDCHLGRDIFMGWTMIKAERLTVDSIMAALKSGSYYASCGPVIEDFRIRDGKAIVKCSPVSEVNFMSRRQRGNSLFADDGAPITHAECGLAPIEGLEYVRAEVVDQHGRRAWTNPLPAPPIAERGGEGRSVR